METPRRFLPGPDLASTPDAQTTLAPGMRLGKHQLVRRLAAGGMAELFLARALGIEGFEKLVVVKTILPQHASDDDFVRMFLDEARLAATLTHPNIAQVFDIGMVGTHPFFTMEYVEGADLSHVLKKARSRGGLPLEAAITIVHGVAAGLHHAHEKRGKDGAPLGIVHRDVSPSNVIVSHNGNVKVVDFGIAKAAIHRNATRAGTVKGKISWMSPEQCRGESLDRRSDVFAIGALLYELTTGTRPFTGDNEYAVLRQIVESDVRPPSQVVPGYPAHLETIVLRALRRGRDERYASAQELQIDLECFARDAGFMISSVELGRTMEDLFADETISNEASADLSATTGANTGAKTGATMGRALSAIGTMPTLPAAADIVEPPTRPTQAITGRKRRRVAPIAIGLSLTAALAGAVGYVAAQRPEKPPRNLIGQSTFTATPARPALTEPVPARPDPKPVVRAVPPASTPAPPRKPRAKKTAAKRAAKVSKPRPPVVPAPPAPAETPPRDLDAPFPR